MSKALITNLRKLGRKKYRMQQRQFVAEGLRTVGQIIANKTIVIEYLVFDESVGLWEDAAFSGLNKSVKDLRLPHRTFIELSDTSTPQGVLAVCRMPEPSNPATFRNMQGCLIALNRIQDPGNAGTILRTASWFGACGLLCDEGTVDLFHPKVVRSTAGATGSLAWWVGDLEEALAELESHHWKSYVLDAGEHSLPLKMTKRGLKSILVVGNEAAGLDKALIKDHRPQIKIPGGENHPAVESLNASVALSIALYEFMR